MRKLSTEERTTPRTSNYRPNYARSRQTSYVRWRRPAVTSLASRNATSGFLAKTTSRPSKVKMTTPRYSRIRTTTSRYSRARVTTPRYSRVRMTTPRYNRVMVTTPGYNRIRRTTSRYGITTQSRYSRIRRTSSRYNPREKTTPIYNQLKITTPGYVSVNRIQYTPRTPIYRVRGMVTEPPLGFVTSFQLPDYLMSNRHPVKQMKLPEVYRAPERSYQSNPNRYSSESFNYYNGYYHGFQ